jgi:hypothetical protein
MRDKNERETERRGERMLLSHCVRAKSPLPLPLVVCIIATGRWSQVNRMDSPSKKAKHSVDHLADGKHAWPRPHIDCKALADVTFQVMDATYSNEKTQHSLTDKHQAYADKAPVIKLYGVNEQGNSVLAHLHGFRPYFYVDMNSDKPLSTQDCAKFQKDLNSNVRHYYLLTTLNTHLARL